jgi:GxxExxY protein
MDLNHLSSDIIKAAINVHKELGPGLLESVYQICLAKELAIQGKQVKTEVPVPIYYKNELVQD